MDEATIRKAVGKHFDYSLEENFQDVVEGIVSRTLDTYEGNEDELYEAIFGAIDDGLIYTKDQWTVLEHYYTPSEANFQEAIEQLENDVYEIVKGLLSEDEEEDEED